MVKILLVADANVLQLRMESSFRNNGLHIDEVKRVENIDHYKANEGISLYIVDLDSHDSSVNVIRKLKQIDNKPIITMSEKSGIHLLKQLVVAGSDDFIIMPYADVTLIYKVQKLLGLAKNDDHSPNKYVPVNEKPAVVTDMMLHWSEKIEINVPEIDAEHKSIIENYEKLYKLMRNGEGHEYYEELINVLDGYVHTHFSHEEILHEEKNYPLAKEHKEIHDEFKESVHTIVEERKNKEVNNLDLIKISLFIKNWWVHHILIEDMKFAKFLESKEA